MRKKNLLTGLYVSISVVSLLYITYKGALKMSSREYKNRLNNCVDG